MKILWKKIGYIAYWLCWPALFVYLRFSRRTRVLVVCDGEVLVVQGWLADSKWYLPGGGLHRRENIADGAVRELREETGIHLKASQLIHLGSAEARSHGLFFHYEQFFVEIGKKLPITKQKGEITEAAWIDVEKLNKNNATPAVLATIATWKGYSVSDTM